MTLLKKSNTFTNWKKEGLKKATEESNTLQTKQGILRDNGMSEKSLLSHMNKTAEKPQKKKDVIFLPKKISPSEVLKDKLLIEVNKVARGIQLASDNPSDFLDNCVKEGIEIGYEKGFKDAIEKVEKIIDSRKQLINETNKGLIKSADNYDKIFLGLCERVIELENLKKKLGELK